MTGKKRFGVSIPSEMAEKLDKIALFSRKDRSSVVAKALEELIHEELHYGEEHSCSGLLILMGGTLPSNEKLEGVARVVKASFTVRLNNALVTVLFVEGSYKTIMSLRRIASENSELSRYIPLYCLYKRRRHATGGKKS